MSLREKVGQMTMVWLLGDYTSVDDTTYQLARKWVEHDHVGGIAMSLGTPIEVAAKLNDLQRRAKVPLLVGSDLEPGLGRLEGGVFTHYMMDAGGATVFPPSMAIAATGRDSDAYDVGRITALEGRAVGIQVNFAPVVDVNNNPANPVINTRSFGENPTRVARLSALFVHGARDGGQLTTAKHFPGHGDTDADSHTTLPVVGASMARLDSVELIPFEAAIDAGAAMVMTAHVALPAVDSTGVPATLSHKIITGLLRDTLHFTGVAITDAMTMEGIGKGYTTEESSVLAIKAGADILLKPTDPTRAIDALVSAVVRGKISEGRIDSAVRRILELKARVGLDTASQVSLTNLRDVVGVERHRAVAERIARNAMTLLRDRDSLVPLRTPGRVMVVQYMPETELKAGRIFGAGIRAGRSGRGTTVLEKIGPSSSRETLDSLMMSADSATAVVVATYVRRVEGEGKFAVPEPIAAWIDSLAKRRPVVVVSFGNPYLLRQFPSVTSYMVTYGVSDVLERAAVDALIGRAAITGKVPVSLPGFFVVGDGIQRGQRR